MDLTLIKMLFLCTISTLPSEVQQILTSDFLQLDILTNLANEANISTILREFQVSLLSVMSW